MAAPVWCITGLGGAFYGFFRNSNMMPALALVPAAIVGNSTLKLGLWLAAGMGPFFLPSRTSAGPHPTQISRILVVGDGAARFWKSSEPMTGGSPGRTL